ncbi:DUF6318 family protein [Cellulomonas soli]
MLVLGGCASQAADRPQAARTAPQGAGTRTPVPTVSRRPSAAPVEETVAAPAPAPAPPADLARTDVDGAIAAGVHLLALLDHAYASGDTAPLLALSGPGCGWCRSMADQLGGGTVVSRGSSLLVHTPTSATAQDNADGTYVVELTTDESYLSSREVDGVAVLDLVSAQTYVFAFSVARTATGWQVDGVALR